MEALTSTALEFAAVQFAAAASRDGSAPTPCERWSLRELQNHTVGALTLLADVLDGVAVEPERTDPHRLAATDCADHVAALAAAASRLRAVAADEPALDHVYSLRGMELPGRMILNMALTDAVVHGWDVSVACGSPAVIPDRIATPLLEFAGVFAGAVRGQAFGPEVATDRDDASARLVAFLGRTP